MLDEVSLTLKRFNNEYRKDCTFPTYLLTYLLTCLLCTNLIAQDVYYSTKHFGVNANPVPRMQHSQIDKTPSFGLRTDQNLSSTETTTSVYLDLSFPLVPNAVDFRVYGCVREFYRVDKQIAKQRGMPDKHFQGSESGDYYIQTRIRLLKELANSWRPNIILNSTLKTASSAYHTKYRRYFDTPGYFFSLESGKNLYSFPHIGENYLRLNALLGFMCWETTESWQDDAYMYGLQLDFKTKHFLLSFEGSGYTGWLENRFEGYGDRPFVLRFNGIYQINPNYSINFAWEKGLRDFPYHQLSLGFTYHLSKIIRFD